MSVTAAPPAGLGSVIVRRLGRDGTTRRCIEALVRHTRSPWELIVLDDGSDGETAAYLAGLRGDSSFRVEIVPGPEGRNPGRVLDVARGDYLAFVEGDAVVTDAWLDQLAALAESDPGIGLAGPMTNDAPPPQRVADPAYADQDGMHSFAARWRDAHRGRWFTAEKLSGPCRLIKRKVLGVVAGAGEATEADPFGDDLTSRVERAGYAAAVAYDLFIHRGPWPAAPAASDSPRPATTRITTLSRPEFAGRYGNPDTARALCGYTPPEDTHAVLTLLAHARPLRILEIGTAFGHMTANLAEWSPDGARVVSVGAVRGMDPGGAPEQECEAPRPGDLGRLAGHFGKVHKVEVVASDTGDFDFGGRGPIDFAFVDGGHGLDRALHDSRGAYGALAPGGWLVWHDVGHSARWVRVREAIERAGFAERVEHVEGTMVAFLRKGGDGARAEAEASPLRLVWEGDFDGLHSLGLINRSLCRALLRRGVDLGLSAGGVGVVTPERLMPDAGLEARRDRPPAGGPPHAWVAHRWPPRLEPPPAGRWAFFQPWEYGSLPRAWRGAAGRADEVWAYSHAVRDVYLEAGIPPGRVHVVPLGVDPEVFRPGCEPMPLSPGPRYRFLFVGGTIHRKGIDVLLAAYERAFRPGDGVGLVVQDMGVRSFYRGQTAGAAVAALRSRGYPVEYREDPLPPGELARLYASCDCAVQPYRGEGFALPAAEAMACGLPVIVTGAGPALDYASPETAYLIPARRVASSECRAGDVETVGRPWLWEPDAGALAELMRRVASDPESARATGAAAARSIRANFTWDRAAAAVEARLRALAGRDETSPVARRGKSHPRVSLTMIVRDEERNLPACLASARGLFDEVIVVDTGSADRTVEIARSFGARVFDFAWVGDFAAARNAALARTTGDYAFWLDADDVLDPPQRERLGALLDGLRFGDDAAYVVRCACDPDRDGGGGETVVDHVRLFPALEGVRWTYRVHEQILPALRRAGVPVRWSDVTVRHTGYTDTALRRRKLARDEAILLEDLEERPGDPFILFNLGSIAIERQDWRAALGRLTKSLAGSAPTDSITRKLFALIARSHQMLGEVDRALSACASGLEVDPDDAELLFRRAVIHRGAGDRGAAEACWRRVLTLERPEQFASLDMGIYGHLTRRNLAVLAEERGDRGEAMRLWEAVLDECPGDRDALRARHRLGVPKPIDEEPAR